MSFREPLHRRKVLKGLLLITAVSGVIFFVLNYQRGMYTLAYTELAAAVYSLGCYRSVSTTENLRAWTLAYLIPFLSVMMFALARPGSSDTIFVWVLLIPQITYLLMGVTGGFIVTAVYLLIALVIFILRYLGGDTIKPVGIANVVICTLAIWSFAHIYEQGRARYSMRLLEIAERDPLTGLLNRRRLAEIVESEIRNSAARNQTVAFILLDLDHFKQINDTHGHPAGDDALIYVTERLHSVIRKTDYIFRVGGEEFCILLPGADLRAGSDVAENARRALESGGFYVNGEPVACTASFGVAISGSDGSNLIDLYHAADQRMYAAIYAGRNRVVFDDVEVSTIPSF